jgi:hypothetical protein
MAEHTFTNISTLMSYNHSSTAVVPPLKSTQATHFLPTVETETSFVLVLFIKIELNKLLGYTHLANLQYYVCIMLRLILNHH